MRACLDPLSGDPTQPLRGLRGAIEPLLTEAGYGKSLVKDFWRKL